MSATLIPAAILLVIAIVSIYGLRRCREGIRVSFDAVCFLAVSAYFLVHHSFPIFPPLSSSPDGAALGERAIGGAWWLLGSRLVVMGLWRVHRRDRLPHETRLFFDISAAAIYIATAIVILNSVFALPVAGLVATSGVVAIVIGLALQNTLADVFAGIAVGVEAPFHVGDRIQIDGRIEGLVVQANWRSIRVQTDSDDTAIIPNSLIAKAEIVNRSCPSERRTASVDLTCPNLAVPEHVIAALLDATLLCPDIQRSPGPSAVLSEVGIKRSTYKIFFFVNRTQQLSSTKDLLLRSARRQLHYGGLFDRKPTAQRIDDASRESGLGRRLLLDAVIFECLTDSQLDKLAGDLPPCAWNRERSCSNRARRTPRSTSSRREFLSSRVCSHPEPRLWAPSAPVTMLAKSDFSREHRMRSPPWRARIARSIAWNGVPSRPSSRTTCDWRWPSTNLHATD